MVDLAALSVVVLHGKGALLLAGGDSGLRDDDRFRDRDGVRRRRSWLNQPPIALFMATIKSASYSKCRHHHLWLRAARPRPRVLSMSLFEHILENWDMVISSLISWQRAWPRLVATLALFIHTCIGRALRAVADDHQAACRSAFRCKTFG